MAGVLISIRGLLKAEEGSSLVEYALTLALIAVVTIGAITALGQSLSSLLNRFALMIANA